MPEGFGAIFGGGGGVIVPAEIDDLHSYGIDRIYSPEDGRALGLEGMIRDMIARTADTIGKNGREALPELPQLLTRIEAGEVESSRRP